LLSLDFSFSSKGFNSFFFSLLDSLQFDPHSVLHESLELFHHHCLSLFPFDGILLFLFFLFFELLLSLFLSIDFSLFHVFHLLLSGSSLNCSSIDLLIFQSNQSFLLFFSLELFCGFPFETILFSYQVFIMISFLICKNFD